MRKNTTSNPQKTKFQGRTYKSYQMWRTKPYDRNQSSKRYSDNRPNRDTSENRQLEDEGLTVFSRRWKNKTEASQFVPPPLPSNARSNNYSHREEDLDQDANLEEGIVHNWSLEMEQEDLRRALEKKREERESRIPNSSSVAVDSASGYAYPEKWLPPMTERNDHRDARVSRDGRGDHIHFNPLKMQRGKGGPRNFNSQITDREHPRHFDSQITDRDHPRHFDSQSTDRDHPRHFDSQSTDRDHPRHFDSQSTGRGDHKSYNLRKSFRGDPRSFNSQTTERGEPRNFNSPQMKKSRGGPRNFNSQSTDREHVRHFDSQSTSRGEHKRYNLQNPFRGDNRSFNSPKTERGDPISFNSPQMKRGRGGPKSFDSQHTGRGDQFNSNRNGRGGFHSPASRKLLPNFSTTPGSPSRTSSMSSTSTEQSQTTSKKPKTFKNRRYERELDPAVLKRREKQLSMGRNSVVYENYIQQVPKNERTRYHLRTPDKNWVYGRRHWESMVKNWRKDLHDWKAYAEEKRCDRRGNYKKEESKKSENNLAEKKTSDDTEEEEEDPDTLNLNDSDEDSDDDDPIEFIDPEIYDQQEATEAHQSAMTDPNPPSISLFYPLQGDDSI